MNNSKFISKKDIEYRNSLAMMDDDHIKKELKRDCIKSTDDDHFNVFLSHAYRDVRLIGTTKDFFERRKITTYVDWINDRELDRTQVSPETATRIQKRIRQSDCLVFLASEYSKESKWVSWEIGYSDAAIKKVAILPIIDYMDNKEIIYRQEYLGLYPLAMKPSKIDDANFDIIIYDPYNRFDSFDIRNWFTNNNSKH